MSKVTITATIVVDYDFGRRVPKKWKIAELIDVITEGVCGHSQISDVAGVNVDKIEFSTANSSAAEGKAGK
jgi:hypothetical protein